VHVTGDLVDLQNVLLRTADHSVQVLTGGVIAAIPREALKSLMHSRPLVAEAMWYDTLVDASIHREWIANLGRRSARAAMSHLLCEFGVRLQEAGLGSLSRYEMPMTQEELADALGLTSVHVNRTLMSLKRDGLAQRRGTLVYIDDWTKLAIEGDFTPQYLHLQDEVVRPVGSRNVEV
jgi:CRP-like cAMP-binding protein